MTTIITEAELMEKWIIKTPKEEKVFKRMLNPNLPKRVCPTFIDPKHVIRIGSAFKFYFDPERGIPAVKRKP